MCQNPFIIPQTASDIYKNGNVSFMQKKGFNDLQSKNVVEDVFQDI